MCKCKYRRKSSFFPNCLDKIIYNLGLTLCPWCTIPICTRPQHMDRVEGGIPRSYPTTKMANKSSGSQWYKQALRINRTISM